MDNAVSHTPCVREYHVYIMTNNSGTLYVGVTGNLRRRIAEHKLGATGGFTGRYKLTRLVYVESTTDVRAAIEREKQIKGWLRRRKIELIASQNPKWRDLSEGEYDPPPFQKSRLA
jgi:putative endonuclease